MISDPLHSTDVPIAPGRIRTPDQLLRVFVSSTLVEVAAERVAVRSVIERLHLAPVMFELGARPHPPRDLYRAYLDQSDVFIGIYWQSYGWVAPGEAVSGLEDEYLHAPADMPKLIYIKAASEREPRLNALLARVRDDNSASYKRFEDPAELAEYVLSDLAVLLAERFAAGRPPTPALAAARPALDEAGALPAPFTEVIGRDEQLGALATVLGDDRERLVTLIGPGGIGKSRLAIEAAGRARGSFPDGVVFVDLAPVHDSDMVIAAVAQSLGVRNTGETALEDKVVLALRDRRVLLVLDNFEQVLDATPVVRRLLAAAPLVTLLVTSRSPLRVGGERAVDVLPLALPDPAATTLDEVVTSPAVALFLARARAVRADFYLTEENARVVAELTTALDGVPLAIELAAATLRVLSPSEILERLRHRLPLPSSLVNSLPERQRTLQATIGWSVELLSAEQEQLLLRLGVFVGRFSLAAAEHIARAAGISDDPLDLLSALVDSSLVRQHDHHGQSYFSMLVSVREYATDRMATAGTLAETREAHADYYVSLAAEVERELDGPGQLRAMQRLTLERDNLSAVIRFLAGSDDVDTLARFAWSLYLYWWVAGELGQIKRWMDVVLASASPLSPSARAVALYFTSAIRFWQDQDETVVTGLTESAALFHREGDRRGEALGLISIALALLAGPAPDPARADEALAQSLGLFREADDSWGQAMTLVAIGRVAFVQQNLATALTSFETSVDLARRHGDELGMVIALNHMAWCLLMLDRREEATESFDESLRLSARLGHDEGIAYGLEGEVALAADAGEMQDAAFYLGAAEGLRERTGVYNIPAFAFHQRYLDKRVLSPEGGRLFARSRAEGRAAKLADVVARALRSDVLVEGHRALPAGPAAVAQPARPPVEPPTPGGIKQPQSSSGTALDPVLRITRGVALLVLPFLAVAVVLLYGFPTATDVLFAWTIEPPITAMVLGSAYAGGIVYFVQVLRARRWHRVRFGFPAVLLFATLMAIATLLHWDRFHPGHVSFIAWAGVYAVTPFLVAAALIFNERAARRAAAGSSLVERQGSDADLGQVRIPLALRVVLAAIGAGTLLAGIGLFLFPGAVLDVWAWPLTPLTARVTGAVLTLPGAVNLWLLRDARWSGYRYLVQAELVSLVLLAGALVIRGGDLVWGRPAAAAFAVSIVGSLVLFLATYLILERGRRARAEAA